MINNAKSLKLKEWYMGTYPEDEFGEELDEKATFYDLFEALDRYEDVYDKFKIDNSFIRERLFEKLAEIMDCDYDYIYDQWLQCKN